MQGGKVLTCQGRRGMLNGLSSQRGVLPTTSQSQLSRAPILHRLRLAPLTSTSAASGGAFDASSDPSSLPQEQEYKPFPRLNERDPYRLLGISQDAGYEEVQSARNYLYTQYKWHEPSREAIELALDSILEEKFKHRKKVGFRPQRNRRVAQQEASAPDGAGGVIMETLKGFIDGGVTMRTIVNEGIVYAAFAMWALFSADQSFPLAGAFAYSVYMYQAKRVKRNPEGPFFGGNPMIGAILSTIFNLGLACGIVALLTVPLSAITAVNIRQIGGFVVVLILAALGIYLK